MWTPDENKQLVLRRIEARNAGDRDALARLTHADFYDHAEGEGTGSEPVRLEPLDIVAEEDRVVVRARVGGSQEIHIWRLADGLVVEHWRGGDVRFPRRPRSAPRAKRGEREQ
jgi:hypothetical protein